MSGRTATVARRLSASLTRPWGGARAPGEPPVVRGWLPYLGCALPFGRDAPGFLQRCQQRHGDAFTIHLMGRRMSFLLDPRDYPLLFKQGDALSFTPIAREISTRAFGYRSVYSSGIDDHIFRETYSRHLRPGVMGPLAECTQERMVEQLHRELDALPVDDDGWREVELLELVGRTVFLAGVVAMFGRGPVDDALYRGFVRFDRQFARLAAGVPTRLLGTVARDRDMLVDALVEPWPEASAFVQDRRALLAPFVDDRESARVRLSMLWASQANTIPAVFWALALLLDDDAAMTVIRDEIDGAIERGTDGHARLPASARARLRHLDSAVLESLRLCSGGISIRSVQQPLELSLVGGQRCALRPGDNLALFPFLSHRDPEIFESPLEYRFDRFYSERGAKQFTKGGQRLGFALMPFGGGDSMCPGRFLAQSEIKMFLAALLADYDVATGDDHALPGFDMSRAGLGILPPSTPLHIRLRPRTSRS
ncbi:MAG: cytochrome P450 [Deltaproteobacteria bacterium]|nr:cytochrome P450 [Deltaproteobacteria bacterium]